MSLNFQSVHTNRRIEQGLKINAPLVTWRVAILVEDFQTRGHGQSTVIDRQAIGPDGGYPCIVLIFCFEHDQWRMWCFDTVVTADQCDGRRLHTLDGAGSILDNGADLCIGRWILYKRRHLYTRVLCGKNRRMGFGYGIGIEQPA